MIILWHVFHIQFFISLRFINPKINYDFMRTFLLLMFLLFKKKKKQEELGLLFKNQYQHVIARIFWEMVAKASLRSEIQTNFTANYTLKK